VLLGEAGKHLDSVVADGEEGDPLALEVGEAALQLDELRLAVGSPGGAAVEDDERPPIGAGSVQIDGAAVLIGQHDIGESIADGRTDAAEIDRREVWLGGCHRARAPLQSRASGLRR
jgi:hypothetical protein